MNTSRIERAVEARRRNRLHLVQRLQLREGGSSKQGFDALFSLDYMGSAEFEFGAVPESLRAIRAGKLGTATLVCEAPGTGETTRQPVYFVGLDSELDEFLGAFPAWLENGARGKEASYFPEALAGTLSGYSRDVVAWWSLTDHVAWALTPEHADRLAQGFAPR